MPTNVIRVLGPTLAAAMVFGLDAGCGGPLPGDPDAGVRDAPGGPDGAPVGLALCSIDGTRFQINHSEGLLGDTSKDGQLWRSGSDGNVLGVTSDHDLYRGWLLRAGDPNAATLEAVGTYDVASPNFHFEYADCADSISPADCLSGTSTSGVYFSSFAGTFVVDSVHPEFRARFTLQALKQGLADQPGEAIQGTIDGCIAVAD